MSRRFQWRRFLILASAACLLGVVLFAAMKYTSRSDFCKSCHEMRPMYSFWQASGHAGVECTKCHAEPGKTIKCCSLFNQAGITGLFVKLY